MLRSSLGSSISVRALGALTASVALCACGGTSEDTADLPETSVAIGRVSESDVAIAVLRDADAVVAYVCGGATTFDRWTRWYHGGPGDTSLSGDDWAFEIDESGAAGRVQEPDGAAHAWTAVPAAGDAGLYSTVDAGCRTGVVVDDELAAQGVWCDQAGRYAQVTPVTPIDAKGFDVRIALPEGARDLAVERAWTSSTLSR